MISKELLKSYANKLMFDMNDDEYETLAKEFDVILKQMDLIGEIEEIKGVKPMTFPFELDDVEYRNDEDIRTVSYLDALSNAKDIKGREVKVPKVVD